MKTKTAAKTLVTVHSVRAANGRLMSPSSARDHEPRRVLSREVTGRIRDTATSGQVAMKSFKK